MNIETALPILQQNINKDLRHQDHARVTVLAKLYRQLITGEKADELLQQFVRREDATMFEQRKQLTQHITPAVAETLMNPFYRVGRLDNAKRIIAYPEGHVNADKRVAELNDRINGFWGNESADKYLGTRNTQLTFLDPNAWVVIDFDAFNNLTEKARPYPTEYSAEQAVNFGIRNNVTEWLLIRKDISAEVDNTTRYGYQFIMYLANDIIQFTEILDTANAAVGTSQAGMLSDTVWRSESAKRYEIKFFKPKGGEVQAFRTGYKLDLQTNGRTFVNPFHAAVPYFMKTIKSVSEMDLTMALHAFPQKVQRANPCPGTLEDACNNGKLYNGETCGVCKGTGKESAHTTAQDVIEIGFPRRDEVSPVRLDDIVHYYSPPVELLKFQKEYIEDLEAKAIRTVFNSEILTKTTVAQTATERITSKDEMYNTLHPFAEHYSSCWKTIVRLIAAFTDNAANLTLVHEFPSDFKLKTVTELIADLAFAKESSASAFVIQQIEKDIAAKMFADDDTAFAKFLVKTRFTPFLGKSSEEIKFILSSNYARPEDRILWTHSDTIFDDLENEVPGFFQFTYEKQWTEIKAKIAKILEDMPKEETAIDFRNALPKDAGAGVTDVEAEAAAKLKGSVGGAQVIVEFAEKVAGGLIPYQSAIESLVFLFKIEEAQAKALLGPETRLENATVPAVA